MNPYRALVTSVQESSGLGVHMEGLFGRYRRHPGRYALGPVQGLHRREEVPCKGRFH